MTSTAKADSPQKQPPSTPRARSKYKRRFAYGLIVLVICLVAVLYWLLNTASGRDVLLSQVSRHLPDGLSLSYSNVEGTIAGPLTLHDLHFRVDDIDFTAQHVTLDIAVFPLLSKHLKLEQAVVQNAVLDIPPSPSTPFTLPSWPEILPEISLPLAIEANTLQIDDFRYISAGQSAIDISSIRGGIAIGNGYVDARAITLNSNLGNVSANGSYHPHSQFKTDITTSIEFPSPKGKPVVPLTLTAQGNVEHMEVTLSGDAPQPIRVHLDVRGKTKPDWALRASSKRLDLSLFSLSDTDSQPLAFDLQANGTDGVVAISGNATQGDFNVAIEPSQININNQTLTVQSLVLNLLNGRVTLRGDVDLTDTIDPSFNFSVNADSLQWSDGEQKISASTDLNVSGKKADWKVAGKAGLTHALGQAAISLDGHGDLQKFLITTLKTTTPAGSLDTTGQISWSPQLSWNIQAQLNHFDPSYFAVGWNGAITGKLSSKGTQRPTVAGKPAEFDATLDFPRLTGQLRSRNLSGGGNIVIHGTDGEGALDLTIGNSRLHARGTVADTLDINAQFIPFQLDDVLPDSGGGLSGTLKLTGTRNAPVLDADLTGNALKYDTYTVDTFSLNGHLPWAGSGGDLILHGTDLQTGLLLNQLTIKASGAVQNLQLSAQVESEPVSLTLSGNAQQHGDTWQGALEKLRIEPSKGDAWTLPQAAQFYFQQSSTIFRLSESCLDGGAGKLCASADWPASGARVYSEKLPISLVQPWIPLSRSRFMTIRGDLTIEANFKPQNDAWQGKVHIASMEGGLKIGEDSSDEIIGYDQFSIDVEATPQRIHGRLGTGFAGNGYVDATIETGWENSSPLKGDIYLYNDRLFWVELFSPDLVKPEGKLKGHIGLAGTRGIPLLSGEADLSEFTGEFPALGITLVDGVVRLNALPDGSAAISGSMRSRSATGGDATGGTLAVDGTLDWKGGDQPLLLKILGDNFLASDTTQLRAIVAPDVTVALQGKVIGVGGKVSVPSADINLEKLSSGVSTSGDVVVLDPEEPGEGTSSRLNLDLAIDIGDNVKLNGFGLQGSIKGQMSIHSHEGRSMSADGQLDVDGRYTAYGQKLEISRGQINWSNSDVADPNINIRAEREVISANVTAGIDVTGRASSPHASVWSNPETSESEALAYLVLGRSLNTANTEESAQVSAASSALSAGAGLLASQLGAKIGLDDAGVLESRTMGSSVFGIGKYLSPKLYVSYGVSMIGNGSVVTLKYLMRKGFNVEVESSTVETRGSVNWRKEK